MDSRIGHVIDIRGDILVGNLKQIVFKIKKTNKPFLNLCLLHSAIEAKKGFPVTLDEVPF